VEPEGKFHNPEVNYKPSYLQTVINIKIRRSTILNGQECLFNPFYLLHILKKEINV